MPPGCHEFARLTVVFPPRTASRLRSHDRKKPAAGRNSGAGCLTAPRLVGQSAPVDVRVADPLATQFQHLWGNDRYARIDACAGVIIQIVSALERLQLDQGLFRPAIEEGGLGVGLAGAGGIASQLIGPAELLLECRILRRTA